MILFALAFFGGVLTIASPCILPVLPFVFARADKPFLRNGLPMLVGMALTFVAIASLAAVGGGWAAQANQYGRFAALALLAFFGLTLLFPSFADRIMQPMVGLGGRLSNLADKDAAGENAGVGSTLGSALLLGIATGLLWAPCAGPILGLILTGAALQGASTQTSLLLAAYAAGAATSLGLALLAGGRVFAAMKRSLGVGEWVRRGFGLAVLAGVVAIASGLDTGFLARASLANTTSLEQALLDRLHKDGLASNDKSGGQAMMMQAKSGSAAPSSLPVLGVAPEIAGAVEWLNTRPLTPQDLKGKVVLVDFWTYSCINCLRTLPYIRAWAEKYKDQGLVVIGVHAPEFAFERDIGNVKRAVADLGIAYPVAIDNNFAIWRAFGNQYWPAHYFIDAQGRLRRQHFGEGEYDESERAIQQLLAEARHEPVSTPLVEVKASGIEAQPDMGEVHSPETYIGYERSENFASPGGVVQDERHLYEAPKPRLNQWGLSGDWTIGDEKAALNASGGAIIYRFHARDLHLVLGPGAEGRKIRFRVTIDGAPPGDSHGADVDADGFGTVAEQRLYQLIRQNAAIADHTFAIEFLDPGANAYAFTFG